MVKGTSLSTAQQNQPWRSGATPSITRYYHIYISPSKQSELFQMIHPAQTIAPPTLPSSLSETNHKRHHEREQPRRLSERKPQNSIREHLPPQARISRCARDQRPEHGANTHTGSCKTDGRHSGTDVLAGFDEGGGQFAGVGAHGLAADELAGGEVEGGGGGLLAL